MGGGGGQRRRGMSVGRAGDNLSFRCRNPQRVLLQQSNSIAQRVPNAALANAALVLSFKLKIGKNIRDGQQRRKINPKSLGPAISLCCRAGIDAALVKGQFSFRWCTPH